MSNPQTFYTVGGLDLSNIFQPLSLGSSALVTGYKFGNIGADLNTIFAAYPGSGPQASATGYTVGVNDLNTIFAKFNLSFSITSSNISNVTITSTTQNGYNIYTFRTTSEVGIKNVWNPGTCTINFSKNANISVILVGGGGGGGVCSNTFSGGGGGGGVFNLTTSNVSTGVNYSLQVGSGGTQFINDNQNGQLSSLSGGSINLSGNGGNQGLNATTSNGTGGSSSNGGNGGNGGNPGSKGSNGSYNNYTTGYGSILNIGGGGGGGSKSSNSSLIGYGYAGSNGTGGSAGNSSSTSPNSGVGIGAGGGGAPGITSTGSGVGGAGHSGIVIIYIAN